MESKTLNLPVSFINILINLPECGKGYQIGKGILKSGKFLYQHKST